MNIQCPICFDPFNNKNPCFSLSPCGHYACKTCVFKIDKCHVCRCFPIQPIINRAFMDFLNNPTITIENTNMEWRSKLHEYALASQQQFTPVRETKKIAKLLHIVVTDNFNWKTLQIEKKNIEKMTLIEHFIAI